MSPGSLTPCSQSRSTHRAESGFATVSYVAGAAISLWFFALLVNLVVIQYANGVVRAAVDEAARSGAAAGGGVAGCVEQAGEVLDGLLGGPYGDGVEVTCDIDGMWIRASARARFPGLVPPVPAMQFVFEASAPLEP